MTTEKTIEQRIGENLRARRKALKLTQETLAEQACICSYYVHLIEHGDRCPSVPMLCRLAWVLCCPVTVLLEGLEGCV